MFCVLLLLIPPADEVSVRDLDGFPDDLVCTEQVTLCLRWREYLAWQALHHADRRVWDRWIGETDALLEYWGLLRSAHAGWPVGPDWQATQLERLRERIGPERYRRRWSPVRLPDDLPRLPEPPPRRRAA